MTEPRYLTYETVDDGTIAVISLNRPELRNAQNRGLLVELDEAFGRAEADDTVRVVVLRGEGPSFSSGHDLGTPDAVRERTPGPDQHVSFTVNGGGRLGAEQRSCRSGTTSSRTPSAGATSARSPSRRCRARSSPEGSC